MLLKANLHQQLQEGSAHADLKMGYSCLDIAVCFNFRCKVLSETKLADNKQSLSEPFSFTAGLEAQAGYPGMPKTTVDSPVWITELSAEYYLHD